MQAWACILGHNLRGIYPTNKQFDESFVIKHHSRSPDSSSGSILPGGGTRPSTFAELMEQYIENRVENRQTPALIPAGSMKATAQSPMSTQARTVILGDHNQTNSGLVKTHAATLLETADRTNGRRSDATAASEEPAASAPAASAPADRSARRHSRRQQSRYRRRHTHCATVVFGSPHSALPAVDESDKHDSQMCSEYAQEILAYWRASEMKRAPNPSYMSHQQDINSRMRDILADWMVQVQLQLSLKQETLFLAIHILDRFLERRAVTRTKLQLVGCTALLLASKYEETSTPEVKQFVCISDKVFTREQILAMEGIMLNALGFNLTVPLSLNFLQRFARLAGVELNSQCWFLAMYYTELTLPSYVFLNFPPSMIAGAALHLAMHTMAPCDGQDVWSPAQQHAMGYTPNQLAHCIGELYKIVEVNEKGTSKYKAVKNKYTDAKFASAANIVCRSP